MVKNIDDFNFSGRRVFVRVDYNVPLDEEKNITDEKRILESLKTVNKIIKDGGIPILASHLGRPKGKRNLEFSLQPIAKFMREKLNYDVIMTEDCIGELAEKAVENAKVGQIVLLENLRFYAEEEENEQGFAKNLSKLADCYVNDAFGSAHRAHASVDALAKMYSERFPGYLMQKELKYLGDALENPAKPLTAVIGGAKISGKIDVIYSLLSKCDNIIIGGGMTYTFFKALGYNIGKSLLEEDKIQLAGELIAKAKEMKVNLILPLDTKLADKFDNDANISEAIAGEIPDELIGMDIGSKTVVLFKSVIENSNTVVWNGPMGVFEMSNFETGTLEVAKSLAVMTENGGISIIGGGDSAAAIKKFGFEDKVSHVSTGGGASLEFLEGKILPGVEALRV